MRREFSIYLDLVRFSAALAVFGAHLTFAQFTGGYFSYQGKLAADGVAAFFVLSGYVIAYVANEKEKSAESYLISRLARVYSVVVPALLLTIFVDLLSLRFGLVRPVPLYQYNSFSKYLLVALTFSNQLWPLHERAFGNYAFWSLDYEVWYYAAFGCFIYLSGKRKYWASAALLLVMGPRALVDMPMWLMGVGIYQLHVRWKRLPAAGWLFSASLALLILYRLTSSEAKIDDFVNAALWGIPQRMLANSQEFASMYCTAAMVGLSIFAARYMNLSLLKMPKIAKIIGWAASFTFTLYLTQRSFMDPLSNFFNYDAHNPVDVTVLIVTTLVCVVLFGLVTEHKKGWWRNVFRKMVEAAKPYVRPAAADSN